MKLMLRGLSRFGRAINRRYEMIVKIITSLVFTVIYIGATIYITVLACTKGVKHMYMDCKLVAPPWRTIPLCWELYFEQLAVSVDFGNCKVVCD